MGIRMVGMGITVSSFPPLSFPFQMKSVFDSSYISTLTPQLLGTSQRKVTILLSPLFSSRHLIPLRTLLHYQPFIIYIYLHHQE